MGNLHEPGRPEDLPDAELLWKRWAGVAIATFDQGKQDGPFQRFAGHWIDDKGVHWDDSGCTWWVMKWFGDGRALLVGEDESSKVKFHETPIDVLAGAPDWVPRNYLLDLIDSAMVGCVYWFDEGAWHRAPYPNDLSDDGLDSGISTLTTRADAVEKITDRLMFSAEDTGIVDLCDQLVDAAERGAVTENALRTFATEMARLQEEYYPEDDYDSDEGFQPKTDADIAAMFALARRAGLDTPSWTGALGVTN
ncbi:hypothetical protein [Nocardia brasiliensis]|uniref:Uncharacterized protein n=1 Tax=Nocardia brasiliensis (strain ATCC 700358 / HUJEG-1) TaxID=1133849 RepID=K0EY09_NOCB7|nr:hypothetical protein [Nocardia brasiliensis]AFU00476.1 hypothetical protein O3I_012575 [Nocardia brasiliensis ATCC 700358]OCF83777.1 hypothetical protein AW168_01175 [Nocardia brasiliensis]